MGPLFWACTRPRPPSLCVLPALPRVYGCALTSCCQDSCWVWGRRSEWKTITAEGSWPEFSPGDPCWKLPFSPVVSTLKLSWKAERRESARSLLASQPGVHSTGDKAEHERDLSHVAGRNQLTTVVLWLQHVHYDMDMCTHRHNPLINVKQWTPLRLD